MSETPAISPINNKKVQKKKSDFRNFIKENLSKKFFICSHDNPDPDSMSSAFGLLRILNFLGADDVELVYCGEISHPQNRAMQNVLNIPLKKWTKEIEQNVDEENDIFIYVDCVANQKNVSIPFQPAVVIDHHKSIADRGVLFIHEELGACATLIVDLALSMPPEGDEDQQYHCFGPDADDIKDIATALAVGIKTDTIDFRSENTTHDDFKAYIKLNKLVSDDKFHKIIDYDLPPYIFDYERIAWENKSENFTPNFITGLGFVQGSHIDCIPAVADKMKRLQGVQTVVVYAIVGNGIRASIRTSSSSLDAESLCDELFGEGRGGGKHGSAAVSFEFQDFTMDDLDEDDRAKLWELTKSRIQKKFSKVTQK